MLALIAGVGYTCLRDLSFGPVLVDRLKALPWPEGVDVEDLSYSPVAVFQKLTETRYSKIVFVGAVKRGREPGTIQRYRPDGPLPDEGEIQARIGEGVTGVVSLESLLVVCRFFEALPEDVVVLEVEPEDESWGEGFTPGVQEALEQVIEMVREEVGFDPNQDHALQAIYWRDEILQVMYWLRGEGLAEAVTPEDLLRFLESDPGSLEERLVQLAEEGCLDTVPEKGGCYRLSALGIEEGRRRFLDEFAPFLGRESHMECGDPECECHTSGDACARLQGK